MNVEKYTVIKLFTLLNILFEINNILYISESFRDSGETYNKRKVFNSNKQYLGTIHNDLFYELNDKYFKKEIIK